nr:hypothetical protein [Tanacetum cinerariifolium]
MKRCLFTKLSQDQKSVSKDEKSVWSWNHTRSLKGRVERRLCCMGVWMADLGGVVLLPRGVWMVAKGVVLLSIFPPI